MSDFRTPKRTVVTEIKTFHVDSISRTGAFRQSVSALVKEEDELDRKDFNVSINQHFEFENVKSVFGLSCPEPVILTLYQSKDAQQEIEDLTPGIFSRAVFDFTSPLKAGFPFLFDVIERDVPNNITELQATAFNKTTGETEYVTVYKVEEGKYRGELLNVISDIKGEDFDGTMNLSIGDTVGFIFNDTTVTNLEDPEVKADVDVVGPYSDMVIETTDVIIPGNDLSVRVTIPDLAELEELDFFALNMLTNEEEVIKLFKVDESGVFEGTIQTHLRLDLEPVTGDGILFLNPLDIVLLTATMDDSMSSDESQTMVSVVDDYAITGTFVGPTESYINQPLVVYLEDYDLQGKGSVSVPATNEKSGDFIMVQFVETVINSGKFRAEFMLVPNDEPATNTSLPVSESDRIKLTYVDSNSDASAFTKVEHYITAKANVVEETINEEIPEENFGKVSFLVDGLFYLNGSFTGRAIVRGLNEAHTRCILIRS